MLAKPLIIHPTGSTFSISKMSHMGEFISIQCALLFYIPVTLTLNFYNNPHDLEHCGCDGLLLTKNLLLRKMNQILAHVTETAYFCPEQHTTKDSNIGPNSFTI